MEKVFDDDARKPSHSITALRVGGGAGDRRRSVMHRSVRSPRRNVHRRTVSQGNLAQPKAPKAPSPEEFVYQQPAYDPDVFNHHALPQTASGHDRRGWNTQMAVYVKRMGQRGGGYKWMHGQASRYFTKRYNWIGITAIIINALAVAGNIPYVATCQDTLNWIKIVAIILGFLVTITMTFQQFKDYGARKVGHTTSEANYAALYDHVMQQLRKKSRDRQDANDYVEWISKEINDLKGASPLIPPSILVQYRTIIHGQNIADPEGVDEIIIKRDSPSRDEDDELVGGRLNEGARAMRRNTDVVEVVVDPHNIVPRSGRLMVTYNDGARDGGQPPPPPLSERDRIALERWNDH